MAPSLRIAKKLMGIAAKQGSTYLGNKYPKLKKTLANLQGVTSTKPARTPKAVKPKAVTPRASKKKFTPSAGVPAKSPPRPKVTGTKPKAVPKPAQKPVVLTGKQRSELKSKERPNFGSRIGSVGEAVKSSKTHGQLRRKLGRMAARSVTNIVAKPGSTRKEAAIAVRAARKQRGGRGIGAFMQQFKYGYAKDAAKHVKG